MGHIFSPLKHADYVSLEKRGRGLLELMGRKCWIPPDQGNLRPPTGGGGISKNNKAGFSFSWSARHRPLFLPLWPSRIVEPLGTIGSCSGVHSHRMPSGGGISEKAPVMQGCESKSKAGPEFLAAGLLACKPQFVASQPVEEPQKHMG